MFELRVAVHVKGLRDLGTNSNLKAGTPVTRDTGKDLHGTFAYGLSTGFPSQVMGKYETDGRTDRQGAMGNVTS